MGKSI
jgi:hypothetical protein